MRSPKASTPRILASIRHSSGLAHGEVEQDLDRHAELDGGIERLGRLSCGASQVMSLSTRISSDPRLHSDAL